MPYTVFCHVFVSNGRMVAKLIQTVFQCNQFRIAWLSSIKTNLPFSYVSMQMSCKMLLLLCLSYFYFGGFCICNKEFKKVIIATNKCTDVWINSFQSKPPNLFPEFMAKKKATIFRLLPCSSLYLNTLYRRPSVPFYTILNFFKASE